MTALDEARRELDFALARMDAVRSQSPTYRAVHNARNLLDKFAAEFAGPMAKAEEQLLRIENLEDIIHSAKIQLHDNRIIEAYETLRTI